LYEFRCLGSRFRLQIGGLRRLKGLLESIRSGVEMEARTLLGEQMSWLSQRICLSVRLLMEVGLVERSLEKLMLSDL
jgi:hypothetical protein